MASPGHNRSKLNISDYLCGKCRIPLELLTSLFNWSNTNKLTWQCPQCRQASADKVDLELRRNRRRHSAKLNKEWFADWAVFK